MAKQKTRGIIIYLNISTLIITLSVNGPNTEINTRDYDTRFKKQDIITCSLKEIHFILKKYCSLLVKDFKKYNS